MTPDLSDEKTAGLTRLLSDTIDSDRFPLSPRIQTLKAILAKLRAEPVREATVSGKALRATASQGGPKAARRALKS
jgi:hypothetical protein